MYKYETSNEASTRLHNTVFLYKDQPVHCTNVFDDGGGEIKLELIFYPRGVDNATVKLTDPDLEFRKYRLGYMNLQQGASYVCRLPARGRFKQGLCRENCNLGMISSNMNRPEFGSSFKTTGFRDMLLGKYPSFREAVERLHVEDKPPVSVAFDRSFAIRRDEFRKDHLLEYKGDKIGFGSDAFQVPEEFRHLREVIVKSGIRVR